MPEAPVLSLPARLLEINHIQGRRHRRMYYRL